MSSTSTDATPATTAAQDADRQRDRKTLWDKIKGIRFGMLTHRHPSGLLHSHPMTTQNKSLDEGDVLFFFASAQSEITKGLREDGRVNVAYADPSDDSYVSVAGIAQVTHDPARVEQLWSPAAKAWFPQGPSDPDLVLVQVQIEHAEFWDVQQSKASQLFAQAKATLTGKPPHIGEHRRVDLQS